MDNGPNSDSERRGIDLANQGRYAEARQIFEKVLTSKAVPLHRAQVLRNIGLTYEREGDKQAAIGVYQEILAVPGLCETTEGVYLHGQITGHVRRLQGSPIWGSASVSALFAAYSVGAAIGAALGSRLHGAGQTLSGVAVAQDLRYGGAGLGAVLGIFLFARVAAGAGPVLSWIGGVVCVVLTTYVLLEEDLKLGLLTLAILVLVPVFMGSLLAARFRNT